MRRRTPVGTPGVHRTDTIQLTSIEVVHEAFNQTTTRTGLHVVCELARKEYVAGIKANPEYLANEPIQRDETLSAYNYKFSPN